MAQVFSHSVQAVAAELAGRDVTAWEIAERLLDRHPDYGGAEILPLAEREGTQRSVDEWLSLVAGIFGSADVVDGRRTLLALALLEPELGTVFEQAGLTAALERAVRKDTGAHELLPNDPPEPETEEPEDDLSFSLPPAPPPEPAPALVLRDELGRAARGGIVPALAAVPLPPPPTATVPSTTPPARAPASSLPVWKGLAAAVGVVVVAIAAARWLFGWFELAPEPAPTADDVEVTVFAPPGASPGDSVLVQAFVHLPEEAGDARAIATELDATAERRAYRSLETPVRQGSRLDFELRMPGLAVDDPVASLVWRGRTEAVQFGVAIPSDAPARSVIGTLDVSLDGAPIGHVKFTLRIEQGAAQPVPEPQGEKAHAYEYAFVSYSSADRNEVLARVQMLSATHIEFFQDVMSIEPGDRWEQRLEAGIDRCDLFLLFWSQHAKDSTWVRREVAHALARQHGDELAPPEIRPVILERVKPWEELAHLHFNDRALYFMRPPSP